MKLICNLGVTAPRLENVLTIIQRTMMHEPYPDRFELTLCNIPELVRARFIADAYEAIGNRADISLMNVYNEPRSVTWRWLPLMSSPTEGEYWCNIDDDCFPSNGYIGRIKEAIERYPNAILCTRGYPVTRPVLDIPSPGHPSARDWFVEIPVASCVVLPAWHFQDATKDPMYPIAMNGQPLGDDELFFSYWAWKHGLDIIRFHGDWTCKPREPYTSQPDAHHFGKRVARAQLARAIHEHTGWPIPNTGELAFTAIDIGAQVPKVDPNAPWYCCAYAPGDAELLSDAIEHLFEVETIPITDPLQCQTNHRMVGILVDPAHAWLTMACDYPESDWRELCDYQLGTQNYAQWVERWNLASHQLQTTIMVRNLRHGAISQIEAVTGKATSARLDLDFRPPTEIPEWLAARLAKTRWRLGFITRAEWAKWRKHHDYCD